MKRKDLKEVLSLSNDLDRMYNAFVSIAQKSSPFIELDNYIFLADDQKNKDEYSNHFLISEMALNKIRNIVMEELSPQLAKLKQQLIDKGVDLSD